MAKKNSKNELNLDDALFKNIIETMSESVWIGDEDEITVYANPNFCNILGYDLDEMIGRPSYDFWDDESSEVVKKHNKLREKGVRSKYEGKLKAKDGTLVPVFLSGTPLPGGGTAGIMTDMREIESVKEREKELKRQLELRLKIQKELDRQIEALNNSAIIVETDQQGNITMINKYYETLSGYDTSELIGKKYRLWELEDYPEDFKENFFNTIQNGTIWKGTMKTRAKNGGILWFNTTVTPFLDRSENIYKYVYIHYDVTDLKLLNHLKDEFLNMATHELRTPMTVIKGYVSMISDGDTGPITQETKIFLDKMYSITDRLLTLVNDILDVSKLEAGKMKFFDENTDIFNIIKDVYDDFVIIAKEKNIKFKYIFDDKLWNKYIFVDRNRIKQVLINLLSNAFKFTQEKGTIIIKASVSNDDKVLLEVHDTGVGIPPEDIEKIFEEFEQGGTRYQKYAKGTGLGLNICNKILKHYNTSLEVESKLDKGSKFYFSIPLIREKGSEETI